MSQILVTGEAKIRDIQGPVVANSGVITALDGAANQYVRGDGTLAIFPTSSGGGSSVSYYLNGSVNQGTFGGSTYYQMSRNAIVGTGTNFSTSSDGLIAQFITDANDPDVVSIPSGNWNVEFFMNVSASSGALASFYVEIYKYNGSTFTLLATNVATPEQLTNTTTVDAYFTSVAMPLSAMAVTDRLAVRIFANVASKTVTLYTEDNRLCQIVTTFSNGLTSLNNLTDQSQYLTTGTSGTDFNIVSSGDTHTFNIPSASASNRGLVTTGSQTIAGAKVFDNPITANSGIGFLNGVMPNITSNLYTGIGGNSEGISIITRPVSTNYTNNLYFGLNNNSYTFPDATGTIALTSDLSSYVPYTGATGNVNLGTYGLKAGSITTEGGYNFKILASGTLFENGYSVLSSVAGNVSITQAISAGNLKTFTFDFSAWATNTSRTYTLPDITGTLALLEGTQTFSGAKTFANNVKIDNGVDGNYIGFKQYATGSTGTTGFTTLYSISTNGFGIGFGTTKAIQFDSASITTFRTYTFPDASGTVALTSDLSSYVPYTGATTNVSLGSANSLSAKEVSVYNGSGYNTIIGQTNGIAINFSTFSNRLYFESANNTFTFPNATGIVALTSNLSAYLPLTGGTLTGALNGTTATFSGLGTFYQLTMTGATAGRLFYAQTGGVFSQSGNLVWDNTNEMLGVGTPNPSALVTAFSTNAATQFKAAGTAPAFTFSNTLTSASLACVFGLATANNHFITGTAAGDMAIANQSTSAGAIVFGTGTFEKMRMSSGGNFGIGTSSPKTLLQINGGSGAYPTLGTNVTNSIFVGRNDGLIGMYLGYAADGNGWIQQMRNDSATAANLILQPSGGNVGIGTSSPVSTLDARGILSVGGAAGTYSVIQRSTTPSGSQGIILTAGTAKTESGSGITFADNANSGGTIILSGNSSDIYGGGVFLAAYGQTASANIITFSTRSGAGTTAERMIITSGGYLKQKANGGSYFGGPYNEISNLAGGGSDINLVFGLGGNSNNTSSYFLICAPNNAGDRMYIYGNGNIVNTNGSYGTLSDATLKENIVDATPKLDNLLKLKVRNFNLIGDDNKQIGFIAQEFEEVFPSMIDIDGKSGKKAIKTSVLVPMLVKAIQELTEKVNELESKIK